MDRVIVVDKPAGLSSHDVVQRVRHALRQRRVGHAGTLDPAATGVLVILAGRSTRLSQFLTVADKEYEGRLVLGTATDTQDADGAVTATGDYAHVTERQLQECLTMLTGDQMQVPPMVSAVKRDGRPLYELARRGIEVVREPRRVVVREFELLGFEPPNAAFRVVCSKGTYVRTLVSDIGDKLGCGAHLGELRRTRSGEFALSEAIGLRDLGNLKARGEQIGRSLFDALTDLPTITLTERQLDRILEGQAATLDEEETYPLGTIVRTTPDGVHLTAIARVDTSRVGDGVVLKPVCVFGEEPDEETR